MKKKENSMSMEKNGAINSGTPQGGCCGGSTGCESEKKAATQLELKFPEDSQTADAMEGDLIKKAIDQVADSTQKPS
tara:strand:+ start:718 stop:948 length:231 start_codon:yes stop_codon:yes gene_type:complete